MRPHAVRLHTCMRGKVCKMALRAQASSGSRFSSTFCVLTRFPRRREGQERHIPKEACGLAQSRALCAWHHMPQTEIASPHPPPPPPPPLQSLPRSARFCFALSCVRPGCSKCRISPQNEHRLIFFRCICRSADERSTCIHEPALTSCLSEVRGVCLVPSPAKVICFDSLAEVICFDSLAEDFALRWESNGVLWRSGSGFSSSSCRRTVLCQCLPARTQKFGEVPHKKTGAAPQQSGRDAHAGVRQMQYRGKPRVRNAGRRLLTAETCALAVVGF